MPDGLLLIGAGLVTLAVFVAVTAREDRRTGRSAAPGWRGWLLLAVGTASVVAGSCLLWLALFSG